MNKKTKTLGVVALVLAVAGVIAGVAIAETQTQGATAAASSATQTEGFLAKVAANLGISEDALVAAMEKAHLETIDEFVAAGRLTAEEAASMKARLTTDQALRKLISQGVASGQLTQDQADLLANRVPGGAMMGGRGMMHGGRSGCGMEGRGGRR